MSTVSHELRTPLNAIIVMNECLKDKVAPNLADSFVRPSLNAARLLLSLIQDILDSAQIAAQSIRMAFTRVYIRQVLSDAIDLLQIQAVAKGVELCLEVEDDVPRYIWTDAARLRQVIINLTGNALKFTSKGSVKVIATRASPTTLSIAVQDTGIGIRDNDKAKLFTAFVKLDREEAPVLNAHGVGLGLAISQSLVRRLGPIDNTGIGIESTYGEGSKFSFLLENKCPPGGDEEFQDEVEEDSKTDIKNTNMQLLMSTAPAIKLLSTFGHEINFAVTLKVPTTQASGRKALEVKVYDVISRKMACGCECAHALVVDDNQFNIYALRQLLDAHGLRIEGVFSAEQFDERLSTRCKANDKCLMFDIIFMDCDLPIRDGFALTGDYKHRVTHKQIRSAPVIATTAFVDDDIRTRCFEAGMDDFISKPVDLDELARLLLKWL
eukprot:TRINITY_DN6132_c0_g1_i3.p1 TRINITY_DN6132_c0_g1~~TRINITY_DN6132_c0_g1_i3.p1  ORF type:complete len:438 (+),score=81.10 TRINITY_DN6132_c0_g1_i3:644-1957(+)